MKFAVSIKAAVAASLLVPLLAAGTAGAADQKAAAVHVELNKLEAVGSDCRTTWVLKNGTAHDFDRLRLDLVAFDADGIVARRVGADMGPIPQERTRVMLFDLKSMVCGNVGRMLMNGVLACEVAGGGTLGLEECGNNLTTSSRAPVPFSQ